MHLLMDCDILCYEMGSAKDPEGFPLSWGLVQARIDARINSVIDAVGANTWQGYLTSQDKSNFRYNVATIKPYKAQRTTKDKPFWYQAIYDYLRDIRDCEVVYGQEADDALAIAQWTNLTSVVNSGIPSEELRTNAGTVLATRDKDLLMVPGWHYRWPGYRQEEQPPFWITPTEGLRSFYKQLLTGDPVDNIHGLYGVGSKSIFLKRIDKAETEQEMFLLAQGLYESYYGSYWRGFMLETGRLLWMRRNSEEMWEFPEGWEDFQSIKDASG